VRAPRGLWPYVGFSVLLHVGVLFFYVHSVSGARFPVPHPDALRVSLVQIPGGGKAAGPSGPPPAPPADKKEEKAVRIPEKPRPMKPKEQEKKPEKKPEKKAAPKAEKPAGPETGSASAVSAGGSGTGGGTGTGMGLGTGSGSGIVSLDGVDFPFLYYLALIEARIGDRWVPPEGIATGAKPPSATVRFHVLRDGSVRDPEVSVSSGISYFDLSAIRAVLDSDPFPPLPDGFAGDRLGVNFVFRFED